MAIGRAWSEGSWVDAAWETEAWRQGVRGSLSVIDEDDILVAVGTITIKGTLSITEEDDTIAAAGIIINNGFINETDDDDILVAAGFVIQDITGTLNVIDDDDTVVAIGIVDVKFVIDILDLNLTIPKADEDPAEQLKVLIENFTLIQQALRNLGQ